MGEFGLMGACNWFSVTCFFVSEGGSLLRHKKGDSDTRPGKPGKFDTMPRKFGTIPRIFDTGGINPEKTILNLCPGQPFSRVYVRRGDG